MIIIPTYNEQRNIRQLVGRIRKVLPDIPVLFVEDSSPDGTAQEIKNIQFEDKNIHMLMRPKKSGFASAYLDGFKKVKDFNAEYVVTMDADLSHPPEQLIDMINLAKEGKVAVGSRYVKGGEIKNWSWKRKILSRFANNIYARFLLGSLVNDSTSGFMAIPAAKLKELDFESIRSRGYAFLMELKNNLVKTRVEFVEVPIVFEERKEGVSKLSRSILFEGVRYPIKIFIERQFSKNFLAWTLFLVSLAVYIYTLPRTIFFGDSPEFMASASSIGIPHPPGYPAYVLLAKLFTFLPFGNVEFRIGLFSAVCASLSLVVLYYLLRKVIDNQWISFSAALAFGFTNLFWSQAIMAKVYVPLVLLALLIVWLCVRFFETKQSKYLILTLFLFGIGSGIHQILLLLLPILAFVIIMYLTEVGSLRTYRFSTSAVLLGGLLFIVGLGIYAFLPIRFHMSGNFYNFPILYDASRPGNWEGFMHYVLRSDYADYVGEFLWKDKLLFFGSAMDYLWKQFYWLLILVPFGLFGLRKHGKFLGLTLSIFILNISGIVLIRTGKWGIENEVLQSYYYLPAYAMVVFWIAFGFYFFVEVLQKRYPNRVPGAFAVLILVPVYFFIQNLPMNNLRNFDFVDRYTTEVLESLPPNAVFLINYAGANTDTVSFGFHFQQIVKNIRPDVDVLTSYQMYPEVDRKVLAMVYNLNDPKTSRFHLTKYAMKYYPSRPIYTSYLVDDLDLPEAQTSVSNGLAYQLVKNSDPIPELSRHELAIEKDLYILKNDIYGQDLLAQYYYTQAAYFAAHKDIHEAQKSFIAAINYDYKLMGIDQESFIYYRSTVLK